MITYGFFGLVAICSFVALQNWRAGAFLWLAIAILQDPVRKVTPDNPVYLSVSFAPVYLAAFLGMLQSKVRLSDFGRRFRSLDSTFKFFAVSVAASLAVSLIVMRLPLMRSAVGVMSYVGGIPAVLMGYFYLRNNHKALDGLMVWFAGFTCIMLIGVPLEHLDFEFSSKWLGTIGMEGEYRRWYNNTDYVAMLSGFYRSPEIMGWHAMVLVLASVYLLMRIPPLSVLWVAMAVWGSYGVFMSGRRKMLMMLIVFVVVFFAVSGFRSRRKIMAYLVPALLFVIPGIAWIVDDLYLLSFNTGLEVAGAKVAQKGIAGPLWLLPLVGPFGFGVGTVSQGAQHFGTVTDYVPLVEGGFEKVMVELGLVGACCALLLGSSVMAATIRVVKLANKAMPGEIAPSFCFAMLLANLSAFLIAFQFLGDPFIATFVGLLLGILLSTVRLYDFRAPVAIRPQVTPSRTLRHVADTDSLFPEPQSQH